MKGQEAKDKVIEKLVEAFGDSFIGIQDKKIYIESEENGSPMQVCISMTCPKVPMERVEGVEPVINFVPHTQIAPTGEPATTPVKDFSISEDENEKIAQLMKEFNI